MEHVLNFWRIALQLSLFDTHTCTPANIGGTRDAKSMLSGNMWLYEKLPTFISAMLTNPVFHLVSAEKSPRLLSGKTFIQSFPWSFLLGLKNMTLWQNWLKPVRLCRCSADVQINGAVSLREIDSSSVEGRSSYQYLQKMSEGASLWSIYSQLSENIQSCGVHIHA